MKCNDYDNSKAHPSHMNLDNLDSLDKALHDLGMLSAITEARRDFLREGKTNLNVMRLNTRYVSNVTVGYCMKRTTTKNRLCPYVLPVRHRTKSENSDAIGAEPVDAIGEFKGSIYEPSTSSCNRDMFDVKSPAKRCQSLENLNLAMDPPPAPEISLPPAPEISPELDCVSTRIQKLQVDE